MELNNLKKSKNNHMEKIKNFIFGLFAAFFIQISYGIYNVDEQIRKMQRMNFDNLNGEENLDPCPYEMFDNYDDGFDPEGYDQFGYDRNGNYDELKGAKKRKAKKIKAKSGKSYGTGKQSEMFNAKEGQFDLTIANGIATTQTIELFNYLNSCTRVTNTAISSTILPVNPFLDLALAAGADPTTVALGVERIYFDRSGNLVFKRLTGVGTYTYLTISCTQNQTSYQALFNASLMIPFKIKKLMITVTASTSTQFNNQISYISKSWLGLSTQNDFSPRSYLASTQLDRTSVTIDFAKNGNGGLLIDAEHGLQTTIVASETISMSFFIADYSKRTL